jgi:hypothetical protein
LASSYAPTAFAELLVEKGIITQDETLARLHSHGLFISGY